VSLDILCGKHGSLGFLCGHFFDHLSGDQGINRLLDGLSGAEYLCLLGLELLFSEDPLVLERAKALKLGDCIFLWVRGCLLRLGVSNLFSLNLCLGF
jgi:hypothetical protein